MDILLAILAIHDDDRIILEICCATIGTILSLREVGSKFCTSNVLNAVRKCSERYKGSEQILRIYKSLTRGENPIVKEAVSQNKCTKDVLPKCNDSCNCNKVMRNRRYSGVSHVTKTK